MTQAQRLSTLAPASAVAAVEDVTRVGADARQRRRRRGRSAGRPRPPPRARPGSAPPAAPSRPRRCPRPRAGRPRARRAPMRAAAAPPPGPPGIPARRRCSSCRPARAAGCARPLTGRSRSLSDIMSRCDNVIRHVTVDVVRQLDEAEALAERPFHPPGEVGRVDRQAVAADPGPGRERHVAERLGGRRLDRFPDVDAEVVREHGQLVHERDVDVPEGVLHQLGQLGLAR